MIRPEERETRARTSGVAIPRYGKSLFTSQALRDPFPLYREMRDLGPVVKIDTPDVYALPRFKDVQEALRNPEVLISGQGVGFSDASNSRTPAIINADGDYHRRIRAQIGKPLAPPELKKMRSEMKEEILRQVANVRDAAWVDGIAMLAQHLPVGVVSFLVGLPEDGRQNMLRWASSAFNSVGPTPVPDDVTAIMEARAYMQMVNPAQIQSGSWAKKLFAAIDDGILTEVEGRSALAGYILPSLDTTINAQGNLLYNLGVNRDQWQMLKARPEFIPGAVIESVRHSAVVRWFSRVATADYVVEDHVIPEGTRVMIMYGSANRDERRYTDPDRFDVTRNATDQLGWGTGPHICLGRNLARLEMEVLLEALLETVDYIEVGEPEMSLNQGLFGFSSLPLRLH